MNIIIRDIPTSTSENIKRQAETQGVSQQQLLSRLLEQHFGQPATVLGYIKIDRPGDYDIGDDCPVCDQPAQSWWLQVASDGAFYRMCNVCATSE